MSRRGRGGLAARLLAAQSLVAGVAAVTVWLVASAVGPSLFHSHLRRAGVHVDASTTHHVEDAFRSASAISIGVALVVSLVVAIAVSAYAARRIANPVTRLATAAAQIAAGQTDARVSSPAFGREFAGLTAAFNAMGEQLQSTEVTRRRLLADLAHETRTPIATLDGYLQGVQDGVVTMDAATITMLRTQTARLARLADDITAVSDAEEHRLELHLRPVLVGELVEVAADAAHASYESKNVRLDLRVGLQRSAVQVDPDRIGQVLGNLLDNALRHTAPRGTVTVTSEPAADRRSVLISISDTGDGIPAEHLAHVFERFYRVDRARDRAHGGSGIGLAISKALVEAHAGTITVASPGPGRGATFSFTLPLAQVVHDTGTVTGG